MSFNEIGFRYPTGLEALNGVQLEIPRGAVTAIVGPSGCGKSTLLQLLAGLLKPTSGSIDFNLDGRQDRHRLAMVFQQDTLLPWMTVRDNVALYYRFHRKRRTAQTAAKIDELLELVNLRPFAKAYPKQLSGGMRRRVAFLCSVAAEPEILLLDEPFSSVDEPTRIQIHQDVLRIVDALKMTTVLVTHDLAEAISLSNQVAILSARPGKVVVLHDIPFEGERNVLTLRDRADFLQIYGRLWHDLSRQIARTDAADG